jgi:hypothetical protein
MYIEASHAQPNGTTGGGNLFLYGLKSAVRQHQGCVVDKMADAQLSLFITTMKVAAQPGQGDTSIISVALAVPLNGVPVYVDNYILMVRETESVDGQVNDLLQRIGQTLERYDAQGS